MTTMVDSKIGKTFQRSVGRAKEKLLQNLGKVDRTADEILDEQIGNFTKQQGAATRLQKELNNYIRCIRACAAASRSLLESVGEVYEPEWGGKELLSVNAQSAELLWNDFAHRLAEQVLIPLNTYQGQFPEMRKKIEKRSRKLIDFDGERHALQALQANPRRPEAKLGKQREALEAAKRTYEVLNSELHEELPSLYNSRIVFLVSAMSTLFASENIFHNETSKVYTELEGIVERLSKESAKGNLNFKVPSNAIMNHAGADSPKDEKGGNTSSASPTSNNTPKPSSPDSPSRPTSLNMHTSTSNGDQHSLTPNNKMGDASNLVISNGTTETPINNTTNTNGIGENGILSKTETTETTKMFNGSSSEGEISPVLEVPKPSVEETGKIRDDKSEEKVVEKDSADNTMTTSDSETVKMDTNNNDAVTSFSSSSSKVDEKSDKTDHDTVDKADKVVDEKGENKESKNDPPPATAPSRGINKPLHGILSPKHANGDLSEESKITPGDSKEPGVLYRVRATYRYQKEDVDELSFEAGEIIRVIEYDEPDEQEEGWLLGIKENGEKGLFPANFTRPI